MARVWKCRWGTMCKILVCSACFSKLFFFTTLSTSLHYFSWFDSGSGYNQFELTIISIQIRNTFNNDEFKFSFYFFLLLQSFKTLPVYFCEKKNKFSYFISLSYVSYRQNGFRSNSKYLHVCMGLNKQMLALKSHHS